MIHNHKTFKQAATAFLMLFVLLAFMARSILPEGFMPSFAADGFSKIVICSGSVEKEVTVPGADNMPHGKTDKICDYQFLTAAKFLLTPFVDVAAVLNLQKADMADDAVLFLAFSPLHYFSARAPPVV